MKITICGSMTNAKKIYEVIDKLREMGHEIFSHDTMEKYAKGDEEILKKASTPFLIKKEYSTFKWYYNAIVNSDAILVCNFEKNGVPGYIGGEALMEIGYAYVNDKKIFFLNDIPKLSYIDELIAAKPIIVNNDLSLIK